MFINLDSSLSHIKDPDKKIKMRRIIDKLEIVRRNHFQESTDFLDPYERKLARTILDRFDELEFSESGGLDSAERKIITIYPAYLEDIQENDIEVLRLEGDLSNLSHKDFLGALMNLGISRDKIGDILLFDDYTDIICKREVSAFIILNLEKVGNKNIKVSSVSIEDLSSVSIDFKDVFKIISSLRLDSYISSCYNISRSSSMKIIKSGRVKVNWEIIDKASIEVNEGDTVSVRGYGRSILHSRDGLTKKDNIKTTIRILI